MSVLKLPGAVLQKLHCKCGRYLSSSPINILQDGTSVCNNCIDTHSPSLQTITRNFAYEAIAELFQFPCKYKSHGCRKYIEFNDSSNHEEICGSCPFACPENLFSPCNRAIPRIKLSEHYLEHHPERHLSDPSLTLDIKLLCHRTVTEKYYLIKVNNNVYLLQYKYSAALGKLWLHANHFRNTKDTSSVYYKIKLMDPSNVERCIEFENKFVEAFENVPLNQSKATEIDVDVIKNLFKYSNYIKCYWTIKLMQEELKQNIRKPRKLKRKRTT